MRCDKALILYFKIFFIVYPIKTNTVMSLFIFILTPIWGAIYTPINPLSAQTVIIDFTNICLSIIDAIHLICNITGPKSKT